MLYAEWFFIEGEKVCQLNGEVKVDICTKESYTFLRFRSRNYFNIQIIPNSKPQRDSSIQSTYNEGITWLENCSSDNVILNLETNEA